MFELSDRGKGVCCSVTAYFVRISSLLLKSATLCLDFHGGANSSFRSRSEAGVLGEGVNTGAAGAARTLSLHTSETVPYNAEHRYTLLLTLGWQSFSYWTTN